MTSTHDDTLYGNPPTCASCDTYPPVAGDPYGFCSECAAPAFPDCPGCQAYANARVADCYAVARAVIRQCVYQLNSAIQSEAVERWVGHFPEDIPDGAWPERIVISAYDMDAIANDCVRDSLGDVAQSAKLAVSAAMRALDQILAQQKAALESGS